MNCARTIILITASIVAALSGSLFLYSTTLAAPPCNVVKSKDCTDTEFVTILNTGAAGTALVGATTAEFGGVGVHGTSAGTDGIGVLAESTGSGVALEARGQAYFAGKIGVGSLDPISHVEIVADGTFNNQFLNMTETTSGQTWIWVVTTGGACHLFDANTNTSPFWVAQNGNIGIGTNTPTERLEVAGNVCASGYLTCSDRRFKDDIKPIDSALDKIRSIAGVSYTFSEEYDEWAGSEQGDARQIGLIAQDVETVCPEIVSAMDDGYRTVDYSKLTAVLVEAVKAQQEQIEALTNRIEELDAGR